MICPGLFNFLEFLQSKLFCFLNFVIFPQLVLICFFEICFFSINVTQFEHVRFAGFIDGHV